MESFNDPDKVAIVVTPSKRQFILDLLTITHEEAVEWHQTPTHWCIVIEHSELKHQKKRAFLESFGFELQGKTKKGNHWLFTRKK